MKKFVMIAFIFLVLSTGGVSAEVNNSIGPFPGPDPAFVDVTPSEDESGVHCNEIHMDGMLKQVCVSFEPSNGSVK